MAHHVSRASNPRRLALAVRGVVQGVGFRPFVFGAARACGLKGWVLNGADTVRIEVQGEPSALKGFLRTLRRAHPPQARIDAIDVEEIPPQDGGAAEGFEIRRSKAQSTPRPTIPADLATCAACLQEIRTPGERRHRYPFTNCTHCGPRWSIIERLPYDRSRTSMRGFRMCPACREEYEAPSDRRFHAQPTACPRCGPKLRLLDTTGRELSAGDAALQAAADAVRRGRILALKGLGGFQLVVEATDGQAVARLRERKRRPYRPFAVMLASLDEVRAYCEVSDKEARELASPRAPILLLRRVEKRERFVADGTSAEPCSRPSIANGIAPDNPYLGVMLPYTPLHHLLTAAVGRPIVCTSGNLSEEPMAIDAEDALRRLGPIADVVLTHDRPIVRPVDDSVARVGPAGLQVLRRARGFAPLPIELGRAVPTILAVGGHLKNTVALSIGSQVVLTPHVGDLDSVLSVGVHRRAVRDLVEFFEVVPDAVACDLHPDYASTRHAEELAAEWGVPLVGVQHHHAHVASAVAEHRLAGPVLGFAWDGTGYGPDGTVWGGEMLVCEGADFTRAAHLRTFALPGGEKAVREPRRSALGLLYEILGDEAARHAAAWFHPAELDTLLSMLAGGTHCPRTSSMGRLFDAVAALVGLSPVASFEGQAAMALEFAADGAEPGACYPLPLGGERPAVADWEPLVRGVLADVADGEPRARVAAKFHNALAELAVEVATRAGVEKVALSGGCFQNALLTARVRTLLSEAGFDVYLHRQVPPGDGGIALGQIYVAAAEAKGAAHVPGNTR